MRERNGAKREGTGAGSQVLKKEKQVNTNFFEKLSCFGEDVAQFDELKVVLAQRVLVRVDLEQVVFDLIDFCLGQ